MDAHCHSVKATLPHAYQERYPKTYIIIDATEIFLETPTNLQIQSSTWSNYKHHNTAKLLIGCTPNGAISFVSSAFVGSISDVELTETSGLLNHLRGKSDISVMADRGFTIRDKLKDMGVDLNIPPFLEGRSQLPADEVLEGRKIASVRIHVERAIGRIKLYSIIKGTLPITLTRIANQIICVCAWLVNFQSILLPPPDINDYDVNNEQQDDDVTNYFDSSYSDSEHNSDYYANSELSDENA